MLRPWGWGFDSDLLQPVDVMAVDILFLPRATLGSFIHSSLMPDWDWAQDPEMSQTQALPSWGSQSRGKTDTSRQGQHRHISAALMREAPKLS